MLDMIEIKMIFYNDQMKFNKPENLDSFSAITPYGGHLIVPCEVYFFIWTPRRCDYINVRWSHQQEGYIQDFVR